MEKGKDILGKVKKKKKNFKENAAQGEAREFLAQLLFAYEGTE